MAGNREQVEELHSGRVVKYAYDELHRLTAEEITDPVLGNETISYAHDAFGNRLTKGDSGGTVSYSYNSNDELLSETGPAGLTYGYDNNGNTVSRNDGADTVTYGYDYENRLVSAGSAAYAYDADGIRVGSVTDGSATDYLADKNRQYAQVLEERSDAGSVSYVYGDDLISRKQGGEVRYYVYDGHGSVRQLTDADGAVTDSYIYDAFGNLRDHLGDSDNRYLYAGEQYDPDSGLYYLRARCYDPGSGRFVTHDPFIGEATEPVTLHRYLYAGANPVMYADPGGESFTSVLETLSVIGLSMAISSQIGVRAGFFLFKAGLEKWKGKLYIVTGGKTGKITGNYWGIGGIYADLHLEDNKEWRAEYLLFMSGYTIGLPPAGICRSDAYLEGFRDPVTLQGICSWISLTGCIYKGASYTTMTMGYALGRLSLMPDFSPEWYDVGFDFMGGFSVCIRPWLGLY